MKHPTTTSHVCCTHYVGVIPVVTLRSSTIICPKTPQSAFFGVLSLHWRRASMHSKDRRPVLCIDGTFLTKVQGHHVDCHCGGWICRRHNPERIATELPGAPPTTRSSEQMAQSLFASPTREELGYSRLHDAPPRATRRSRDREAMYETATRPLRSRVTPHLGRPESGTQEQEGS
ncbi:hypothetical protein U9M48_006405 [Paspalum notatum var. saurae]|uniref:Uncharacterized protein n=1 Tax=Paspalum notatum var. saurae TaxID=547442 RepID=A0AAQ3PZR4_PASNO